MFRSEASAVFAMLLLVSCGGSFVIPCGRGTHEDNGSCVPDVPTDLPCGPRTHVVDASCVGDEPVIDASVPSADGGIACGPGTHLTDGLCVPDLMPNEYQVRVALQQAPADGFSRFPVIVYGSAPDGGPSTETIILTPSRVTAGSLESTTLTLTPTGARTNFIPCSEGDAQCLGPVTFSAALASAPSVMVATSVAVTMVSQTGIGSPAPCLTGGSTLYLDGDAQDKIHPGQETITAGPFYAQTIGSSTPNSVFVHLGTTWWITMTSTQLNLPLKKQVYTSVEYAGAATFGHPGLSVLGNGNGCNAVSGAFQVHDLVMQGTTLKSFTATFEQHCDSGPAVLRGCLHYEP